MFKSFWNYPKSLDNARLLIGWACDPPSFLHSALALCAHGACPLAQEGTACSAVNGTVASGKTRLLFLALQHHE